MKKNPSPFEYSTISLSLSVFLYLYMNITRSLTDRIYFYGFDFFPDFQHPMTVIHDQTEGGQPSSHKVSAPDSNPILLDIYFPLVSRQLPHQLRAVWKKRRKENHKKKTKKTTKGEEHIFVQLVTSWPVLKCNTTERRK